MKLTSDYNLAKLYPELAKQWHPTKNKGLTAFDITPASSKKVWWICDQGHEWEASVYNRKYGRGCPYCSGKKVTKENNFAVKHPDLIKEWHPIKNGILSPKDVTAVSKRKIWWICGKGHEWKTSLQNRSRGSGCPVCHETNRGTISRKNAIRRSGSLAEKYPYLVKEWHPIKNENKKPDQFAPKSHEKIWWKCKFGHEWKTEIANRTSGNGCPKCHPQTSRKEIRVYCELKVIFKEVRWKKKIDGIECDIYLPEYKVGIELDGYYWHKNRKNNDKEKTKKLRKKGITVFHLRDDRLPRITETDVFFKYKEKHLIIVKRLLEEISKNILITSEEKQKIRKYCKDKELKNREEFRQLVRLLPSPIPEKSLSAIYPEITEEWHFRKNFPLKPNMFTPKSRIKVWWQCKKNHEWKAPIYSRTSGNGCPYCSGRNATKKNNLANINPKLAREWHPTKNGELRPEDVKPRSSKKVWWLCKKNHEWIATVNNRTIGRGCPYCAGKRASKDNNLAVRFPELAKQWHPIKNGELRPEDVMPVSAKKVWWQCEKGHSWKARLDNRKNGRGCPICADIKRSLRGKSSD